MTLVGKVRLDSPGIADMLKSDGFAEHVRRVADLVADEVRSVAPEVADDVAVAQYVTDRAAASVTIAHPTGALRQARDGTLTRATGQAGLDVKQRP